MRLPGTLLATACLVVLVCPGTARAQSSSSQDPSSKPTKKQKGTPAAPAPPAAADGSDDISRRINNSAPAEHDVEVGQYYMKKEKYDAAIDRFREATQLLPKFALPYRLMGEAYEKKKFLPEAMAAYQKFIEVAPKDKDAEDVQKRVARLRGEIQEEDKRRAAATKP
jgi:tetratricopeptide (TPR) repeat protein